MKKSPLAPKKFPAMPSIKGVKLATAAAGIHYRDRDDLLLAVVDDGTTVAGVLTQSATAGAPVKWCRQRLSSAASPRALIVNAGNANTATGDAGERAVRATADAVAAAVGCRADEVLVASTGVIGEPLPVGKITAAAPALTASLAGDAWRRAAAAIVTTDTFAKGATAAARLKGAPVTINGIAKGSGMIAPNMATLLAFVFTDAAVSAAVLQSLLADANQKTFNAVTVDGDASTSDTCLLFATGAAGNAQPTDADDADLADFRRALTAVMTDLAVQVVRDGEGAQKLITVTVRGAADDADAVAVAKSIANSPLVKTAVAGGDANWGRIVMAVGNAGARVAVDKLGVTVGGVAVAEHGVRVAAYDEAPLARHLAGDEILIQVDLGVGDGGARVRTCDLTHGYIDINADYRT